jgi:trigger factor
MEHPAKRSNNMADEEALSNEPTTGEVADGGEEKTEEKTDFEKLKEAIEVTSEDIGTLRKKLVFTIPRQTIDDRLDGQYGELSRDALVPGFRKGRAPRRLIEKRFGGEVNEQLVTQLVGNGFLAAVEKQSLKVIGDPEIWVKTSEKGGKEGESETDRLLPVDQAMNVLELPDEGPMTITCEVEVRPEFELPELKGIPIKRPKVEITDEDVGRQLERLLAARGTFEPVEGGPIVADDLVVADIKLTCESTVLKEQSNAQFAARPQQVEGVVLKDLGEMLIGKKPGDVCSLQGELPADYEKAEFRGKTATFEFTLHDVKRLRLPELSAAFLSSIGFDSETELRDWVRNDMESRLGETIRQGMQNQMYKYLMDQVKLDLPEGLSARQTNRSIIRRMIDLYRQGVPEAEIDKHLDELKTGAREQAVNELRIQFIMERIAEELDVHVSEDEVNGMIASIAQRQNRRFDRVRDDLAKKDGLSALAMQIRNDKIIDLLLQDAAVTELEGPEQKEGEASEETSEKPERKRPKRKPPKKQGGQAPDPDAT